MTTRLPLPRGARLRLWATARLDAAACWLCDHGHDRAAVWLWRAFRMW